MRAFLDWFFPSEWREAKVEEFINFRQGCMDVLEYSLKFSKFSKYAPSVVSNPRDEMSNFLMGVSEHLVEECRSATLDDNMNICRLMTHAQQVEYTRLRRKNREAKRAKSFDSDSSKGRLELQ